MTNKTDTKATKAATAAPAEQELSKAEQARRAAAEADAAEMTRGEEGEAAGARTDDELELAPTFVVDIVKDPMMKPVMRVFEHEIAILEEIHGADNVVVREDTARDLPIVPTAEEEYSRLETRYGRNGIAALRKVYPGVEDLARASGLSTSGGRRRSRTGRAKDTVQSKQRGKVED